MKMEKNKLFWKLGDVEKHVFSISFDDDEEYYSFLKKQFDMGFRQIIISSEVMIQLIKECVINHCLRLYNVEFAEEDASLSEDIKLLLDEISVRPVLFNTLIEKLHFLAETSSIDISRIYVSGRLKNGLAIDMYIQSNGIIAINENASDELLERLCTLIARCLFG